MILLVHIIPIYLIMQPSGVRTLNILGKVSFYVKKTTPTHFFLVDILVMVVFMIWLIWFLF